MLTELRQEHQQISNAILTLEGFAYGLGKRRGRPPAWLSAMKSAGKDEPVKKRRRARLSAEGRARIAAAAKKRWADWKKKQPAKATKS